MIWPRSQHEWISRAVDQDYPLYIAAGGRDLTLGDMTGGRYHRLAGTTERKTSIRPVSLDLYESDCSVPFALKDVRCISHVHYCDRKLGNTFGTSFRLMNVDSYMKGEHRKEQLEQLEVSTLIEVGHRAARFALCQTPLQASRQNLVLVSNDQPNQWLHKWREGLTKKTNPIIDKISHPPTCTFPTLIACCCR